MDKTISPLELSSLLNKSKQSYHNLSLAEFRVLTYLLACANIKDGEGYKCWPSTDTISEHTGIHTKTVEKVRKSLVDNGWMQYIPGKGKGNCNTYYVNGFKIVECSNKSGVPSPKGIIAPTKLPSATTKKVAKNQDNLVQNQKTKPGEFASAQEIVIPKAVTRVTEPGFPKWYCGTQVFNENELKQAIMDKELADAGLDSPF